MQTAAKTPPDAGESTRKDRARPSARFALVLFAALATAAIVPFFGCGGGNAPLTQPQARDNAASAVCDYVARCGGIGAPPATYSTRDSCLTTWKGNIESMWPVATCTKILQTGYDACIVSINNGTCGSLLDLAGILSKCGKATVCGT